jgi:hypothetical protein
MQKSDNGESNLAHERPAKKLPAVVEKIVKPVSPADPEKVQIAVHGADDLYREIRVENTLENAAGEKVRLKQGAEVDVIIEASPDAVEKKST